jgi:hypothetical protein
LSHPSGGSWKQKLPEAAAEGRTREAELDVPCVDVSADPSGLWAANDHVDHLAWWRDRNAKPM